jgi:hypothetical protein
MSGNPVLALMQLQMLVLQQLGDAIAVEAAAALIANPKANIVILTRRIGTLPLTFPR